MAVSDPVIERIAAYPWPHDGVQARRLHGPGIERPTEIAKQLGVGRASVYRVLEGAKVRAGGAELPPASGKGAQ